MGVVIQLPTAAALAQRRAEHASAVGDTEHALRVLLAARKCLRGLVIYFRDDEGFEDAIFTGSYKANPAEALDAVRSISDYLTRTGVR